MAFGKRQLLSAFLEKDNIKLLAYEISGKTVTRIFGGQISFGGEVLREAFIADPVKFSSQVKMALSQKPEMTAITEVVLFVPPEKTFLKALPAADAIESFIRSLPYFKEELLITSDPVVTGQDLVNHVAFEKKLVEDFERPFLESGKKVSAALSSVKLLSKAYAQSSAPQGGPGKYFFLICFDKDAVVLVMQGAVVLDMATFPKDVFAGRLNEFRLGKNFADVKDAYSLGIFEPGVLDKIRTDQQLNVKELASSDIYDLTVASMGQSGGASAPSLSLPSFPGMSVLADKLPNQKYLFLIGAAIVGFVLVLLLAKNVGKLKIALPGAKPTTSTKPSTQKPPPPPPVVAPQPKPADFKVRVLNGTTVAGEAGRGGEAIKSLGFEITETKNATASGFVATRLRTSADVPQAIADLVKAKLLETYESVSQEVLTDAEVKIEVIIGKKK